MPVFAMVVVVEADTPLGAYDWHRDGRTEALAHIGVPQEVDPAAGLYERLEVADPGLRHKSVIGRERALLDGLSNAMQRSIGGPPTPKKMLAELHRHNSSAVRETPLGNTFEVQIVGPDGDVTGHIAKVTVELDRFEEQR